MFKQLIQCIFIVSLLSACATNGSKDNGKRPDWVMGTSEEYPSKKYITGIGDADTMADAKSRARAELAKTFSVNIQSTSNDRSSYNLNRDKESYSSNSLSIDREIQSRTKQRLEGVKIAQVWQDEGSLRYYAIALLARQPTTLSLRTEISQLDDSTQELIQRIQKETSLISKIRASAKTIPLQSKRRVLNKQLQVVSTVGQGITPIWSVEKLQHDYEALISRVTITAKASGFKHEQLKINVEDTLGNLNFTVLPQADYLLNANLHVTALPQNNGWYYQKATLSISLSGEGQHKLGGHQWDFKVSATEQSLSELRVLEKAQQILSSELEEKIFELIANK